MEQLFNSFYVYIYIYIFSLKVFCCDSESEGVWGSVGGNYKKRHTCWKYISLCLHNQIKTQFVKKKSELFNCDTIFGSGYKWPIREIVQITKNNRPEFYIKNVHNWVKVAFNYLFSPFVVTYNVQKLKAAMLIFCCCV